MKYNFEIDMDAKNAHTAIIKKIESGSKVLEFGPATGYMTKYLKENLNCTVYGVEIDSEAAEFAKKFSEDVIICDVETLQWKTRLKGFSFDYVIFADVLEHLRDPLKVLKEAVEMLNEDGELLLSIPNIAHNAVLIELLLGDFKYRNLGLLDNTHLRFFTRESLIELLENCNMKIIDFQEVVMPPEVTELKANYSSLPKEVASFLKNRPDGHTYQFIVSAKKAKGSNTELIAFQNESHKLYISSDYVQLFWDTGNNFNEIESCKLPITNFGCLQEFVFEIPNDSIQAIRLDPGNNVGFGIIKEISIIDDSSQIETSLLDTLQSTYGIAMEELNEEGLYFLSENEDPQFINYFGEKLSISKNLKIRVTLIFSKIYNQEQITRIKNNIDKQIFAIKKNENRLIAEMENLRNKIGNLEAEIKTKEERVEELLSEVNENQQEIINLKNTISWKITKPLRKIKKLLKWNR